MTMVCKLMGEVTSEYCFECYSGNHADLQHKPKSRVLCKKDNVVENREPLNC